MKQPTLVVLSLYQLLASNRSGLFIVYFPLFLSEAKGASDAVSLIFVSIAYVAGSLLAPLFGRWSDRVGRRKPFLVVAEATALPVFVLVPFLPGYWLPGVAFVIANVFLSIGSPALSAFVADLTRETERGHGYALLNATGFAGGIVGFIAAALLVGPFGLAALFPFVAALMCVTISILVLLVPDVRSARTPRASRISSKDYRTLNTFSVSVSIRSLGIGAVGTYYGVYAVHLGANAVDVSLIAIVGLGSAALVSLPFGRFIDARGEIPGILYGTGLSFASIALFLFATNWLEFFPAQTLRLVGIALLSPAMLAWVAKLAPVGQRAEYLGVFSLINSTLWSLGPLAGGLMLLIGGSVALFLFALGTTVISLVAVEVLYQRRAVRARRLAPLAGNPLPAEESPSAVLAEGPG